MDELEELLSGSGSSSPIETESNKVQSDETKPAPSANSDEPLKVVDLTDDQFIESAQSDSPSALTRAIMHLIAHPERINNLLLDEFQFRKFLRNEISSCTDDEMRLKIRAYQKFGVYLRVSESEAIRIKQEQDTEFLKDNSEKSFLNFNPEEHKKKLAQKTEKKSMTRKEKFWAQKKKMGLKDEKISVLWKAIEAMREAVD